MQRRFLTLADVTEVLNISSVQAYALVRSGELPAIQVGARGVWRVEEAELEAYIQRMYAEARARNTPGRTETDDDAATVAPGGDTEVPHAEGRTTAL